MRLHSHADMRSWRWLPWICGLSGRSSLLAAAGAVAAAACPGGAEPLLMLGSGPGRQSQAHGLLGDGGHFCRCLLDLG